MAEGLDPQRMTETQRLDEIAQLLARGLVRVMGKSGNSCKKPEILAHNCLDVPAKVGPDVAEN
ncbi:MAG: hypothetical protein GWP14_10435 [Actinobacteria bacterium]|nr:hypothetical protein [Actinomycetota bacterium]